MNIDDKLRAAIIDWSSNVKDEWYLEYFIEDNIRQTAESEAFSQLNGVIELLVNGQNDNHVDEIIQVILALARKSNTTEIPGKLHQLFDYMAVTFSNLDPYNQNQINEILKFYRIKNSPLDHLILIKSQTEYNRPARQEVTCVSKQNPTTENRLNHQ